MLFLHIFVSLDGYVEDERGSLEWMAESDDFDLSETLAGQAKSLEREVSSADPCLEGARP